MNSFDSLLLLIFVVGGLGLVVAGAYLFVRAGSGEPVHFRGRLVAHPRAQAGAMLCFAVFAGAGALDILMPDSTTVQYGTLAVRLAALAGGIFLMTKVRKPEHP